MNKEDNFNLIMSKLGNKLERSKIDFEIIQDESFFDVNELKIGLVSGICVWSGYAFGIGNKIINELSSDIVKNEIPVFLLDCDFISPKLQNFLFNSFKWGYFESCWIEHGEVIKSYKYSFELDPFILFLKNRLMEINRYLENGILKSYILDPEKELFGIDGKDFNSRNEAIIMSKSRYNNQFLYNLMKYQKMGHFYLYEDDRISIYDATTPSHLSSCYVRIKDYDKYVANKY